MAQKILVVDDSKDNRFMIRTCLVAEGYQVEELTSGEELVKLGNQVSKFDLILLDVMMPNLNGYEACRILKQSSYGKQVPVIFLSAENDEESKVSGFAVGGVDYISKPYGRRELGMRIKSHLALSGTFKAISKEKDVLVSNLSEGANIQVSLLPSRNFSHHNVKLDWEYLPVEHIAGDMFGFIPFDDGSLGIYLMDVCGHGSSAAIVASTVHGAISSNKELTGIISAGRYLPVDPKNVIRNLGREFPFERFERYFTFLYVLVCPLLGKLICSSSGHPAPYYLGKQSSKVMKLNILGKILGLDQNDEWDQEEINIGVGDKLVLVSDGVLEANSIEGQRFEKKIDAQLEVCKMFDLKELVKHLKLGLIRHSEGIKRLDDQSIVCLEILA